MMALLTACVLAIGSAAGGTIAWLVSQSAPVHNTFTAGGISVTVMETDTGDGDANPNTNTYTMVPGASIVKDPVVTVAPGSEDAWLFVKLDKSLNFDSYMTYAIAQGWNVLEGANGVYWRMVDKLDEPQVFGVLEGNAVAVKAEVTAAMLNALTEQTRPTLTVTAYAVQRQSVATASDAWTLVAGQSVTP